MRVDLPRDIHAGYSLTDDPSQLLADPESLYTELITLCWWRADITLDWTKTMIKHSYCITLFHGSQRIGFARCITDYCAYARLTDVFIKPEHRRKGLAKWLVSWILESSEVKVCGKIELMALENEARLYRECGFEEWKDGRLTFMHRTVKN